MIALRVLPVYGLRRMGPVSGVVEAEGSAFSAPRDPWAEPTG